MNLDGDKPVPVNFEFLADRTGEEPPRDEAGQLVRPWPDAGVRLSPVPARMVLPLRWLRKHLGKRNSITVEGLRQVTRPSRPEPDVDENGSAAVAARHYEATDNPGGLQGPHELLHYDAIVFHTPDGDLRYEVERQADKYVAGDTKGTKPVTPEVYATGDTEVEHQTVLRLVTPTKQKG